MQIDQTETYQYAIKLLAKRDYSRQKLIQKLKSKGCEYSECAEVIDLLIAKNWFREDYYTEGRIKYFARKGHSPSSIVSRLQEEEIDYSESKVWEFFKEYKYTTQEQINELLIKKLNIDPLNLGQPLPERIPDKVMRYVLTRGHSFEDVNNSYNNLI